MSLSSLKRNSFWMLLVLFGLLFSSAGASAQDGGRKVRNKVRPSYPELARKMNVRGTVKIEVVVAPSGAVKDFKVVGGHPLLVGAAEDAMKKWRYEPAAEETTTLVEFNFAPGM